MPKAAKQASKKPASSGAIVYDDYVDNFVVWPGREGALSAFVNQTYANQKHKLRASRSSNSEDALTWSCFDTLGCLPDHTRSKALGELWRCAFDGVTAPKGLASSEIFIGKKYGTGGEQTEVDASIEGAGVLVFIEAKLYSSMSLADPAQRKPHDQLARKLRVGVKEAQKSSRTFYFIVLDIAPKEKLLALGSRPSLAEAKETLRGGFASKWKTAFWFSRYHGARGSVSPLRAILSDIPNTDVDAIARNMGWLTWAAVFKVVLRGVIESRGSKEVR
jgi:hypothetical protein